ncbi:MULTISPECIES: SMP-30/gluconolactonase/LRE family protein [Pseudonocardia]|uniref:Virginiamycin B lyase n=2 Tax=Pseudonocardia TaxID=1847 RepID=A0A1Y2MSW4_PSEAH|nr:MULTISPECIES: SMP-30/gluconolactonase/LRE family protein [Pseudonocardia]OSY38231.1 Virginiamycin B lyase [Pseudonocardia autotrophica]TDN71043.1 gluconolactonase [Pseudonocardia autotrophica]BBG01712.1 gluconolactonase [Pseudonocardia autotrophica]
MKLHTYTGFASGHRFLEGLRWHDGALWASDFFTGAVLTFSPGGDATTVAEVPGAPSGLGFLADGTALVVSQADATVLRIGPDGALSSYADFSAVAGGPGNDLLVAPDGHAYVGNFGFAVGTEDPKPTALAHIDPQGTVHRVDGEVMFPNGMALTPDGRQLLLAETFLHRITAYDRASDGSLSNQRVWAQLPETFMPDGIALDTDGGVWFGNALTMGDDAGFYRVVAGGELTDKVPVTGTQAVACAFGGDDRSTLYLSCNTTTLEEFVQGRSDGAVAVASVGYTGVPTA